MKSQGIEKLFIRDLGWEDFTEEASQAKAKTWGILGCLSSCKQSNATAGWDLRVRLS